MSKNTYSSDSDRNDLKVFRETIGTFGTTTKPGGNQLQELQAKIRQGVKHVELHLASKSKGHFGAQDVPDKYGFEQRRTIMQLAKLNQQTLSVHGTFDIVSFSGLSQDVFDDSLRFNSMKEIDETIKFAAETAKQGAVVFHIQGENLSTDRGELNISKKYMDWLKRNKPEEYKNLEKNYFNSNPLEREFVSDINKIYDIKEEFNDLKDTNKLEYQKFLDLGKEKKQDPWALYYQDKIERKIKLYPDMQPLVVIGDKLGQTQRNQDLININFLKDKSKISENDKKILNLLGIDYKNFDISTLQKSQSIFSNGFPDEFEGKISKKDFEDFRKKVLITYEDVLEDNNYLQAQADQDFHKKLLDFQINIVKLQKDDIEENYIINEEYLDKIKNIELKEKELAHKIKEAKIKGDKKTENELRLTLNGGITKEQEEEINYLIQMQQNPNISKIQLENINNRIEEIKSKIQNSGLQREKWSIMGNIGQLEYQKLEKYNEMKSEFNEKINALKEQKQEVKAVTDVIFEKNTSAIAHLGIKALRYQLDLKQKSKGAEGKVKEINSKIFKLEQEYENSTGLKQNEISIQIQKEKYKLNNLIGLKDYSDIDIVNKPLYLAPENMLPGFGSLTSLEEYKGVIRMSQEDFAKKILSDEPDYKILRQEYEKETGLKISNHEDALKLAKRHLGGTFDNAHAGVWLKHFKKEEGESEEHKIERFNKWLNQQAEDMVKEGIVKHVHFNDTQAKDDDHNLLGSGILDLHDLRERLRKAGLKEALIVEAGGRGADKIMHITNALNIFNPALSYNQATSNRVSSGISDWIDIQRNYDNRPQFSNYSLSPSSFRHQPSQNQNHRGSWSGTNLL